MSITTISPLVELFISGNELYSPVGELPELSVALASAAYQDSHYGNGGRWSAKAVEVDFSDTYKDQWLTANSNDTKDLFHNNIPPSLATYCWKRTA